MCGGANIFVFLGGENVESDQMNFGVTVLSGLGGGHLHDLARAALKFENETLVNFLSNAHRPIIKNVNKLTI